MKPLDIIAKMFVSDISSGRSIDWYLIKLSSTITYLRDCYGYENSYSALDEFLKINIVSEALNPLACYVDIVEESISNNPRFSDLRPYKEILINSLRALQCKDENLNLTTSVREPTFKIENGYVRAVHVEVGDLRKRLDVKKSPRLSLSKESLIDILIIVSAISLITYIIYMIVHQRGVPHLII